PGAVRSESSWGRYPLGAPVTTGAVELAADRRGGRRTGLPPPFNPPNGRKQTNTPPARWRPFIERGCVTNGASARPIPASDGRQGERHDPGPADRRARSLHFRCGRLRGTGRDASPRHDVARAVRTADGGQTHAGALPRSSLPVLARS